ncbi:MAG: YIP1 family protein [Candidatus Edwardsbacteria bacterium]|nr:YIP1 family protein [Candidatus Edwardsbacteria bacterium]
MKWWENILGIFYQPSKVFEGMKQKPQWLVPLIVSILVALLVAVIILKPIVFPEQIARLNANPDIPPEAKERAIEQMDGTMAYVFGVGAAAVAQPLSMLAIAVLFWGIFTMLGGKAAFAGMFAVTAWAGLISIPGSIVKVPLMFIQETIKVHTSLALILPHEMEESFVFRLLSQIDVFTLWMLFVMAAGYSVFSGLERKKSYTAVFAVWGVWALIAAALGGMFKFGGMG